MFSRVWALQTAIVMTSNDAAAIAETDLRQQGEFGSWLPVETLVAA